MQCSVNDFADAISTGDRKALAKGITALENEDRFAEELIDSLFAKSESAWIIGITGAPGAGKSSVINQLISCFRDQQKTVAILAVDPSSPITRGAILGDRIRMGRHFLDDGVFIRSMSSRGHLGGLSVYTFDAAVLAAAAGFDVVIVETVGAGQSEVEIADLADTSIVCEAPGMGDDIQAIKAGIMEIADVFAVNKSDRDGAERTVRCIETALEYWNGNWKPPVVKCNSLNGDGINELLEAASSHRAYLIESGEITRKREGRIRHKIDNTISKTILHRISVLLDTEEELKTAYSDILKHKLKPSELMKKVFSRFVPGGYSD